ncbi:DUF2809 domain-containing protein [Spirosoma sp. KNUC1025]|uniref:ribosomal maturation YjgA family protein n=1 Tax=Spirosoma sp. KNUC1025 TaxID=2894082 RepID=UPI0038630A66|nr:DUF2809 domain-containing protein [Spirosoma sp. KNUC1025]
MFIKRNRVIYGLLMIGVMGLGLASRQLFSTIPFIKSYVGDVLWALMVFLGFALTFNRWPTKSIALATLLFSYCIEISQLYHAPWIERLRATRLGVLVLGFTFVWSDFLCYSLGVLVGILLDRYIIPVRYRSKKTTILTNP